MLCPVRRPGLCGTTNASRAVVLRCMVNPRQVLLPGTVRRGGYPYGRIQNRRRDAGATNRWRLAIEVDGETPPSTCAGHPPVPPEKLRDRDPRGAEVFLGMRAVGRHGGDGNQVFAGFEIKQRAG